MTLVDRAQSDPEDIARFVEGKAALAALTAEDVRAVAARYLKPEERLEIDVLPREGADSR
jgi:zinc protease